MISALNEIHTGYFLNISHSINAKSNLFNVKYSGTDIYCMHTHINSIPLRA
jgi:hypothetical protein